MRAALWHKSAPCTAGNRCNRRLREKLSSKIQKAPEIMISSESRSSHLTLCVLPLDLFLSIFYPLFSARAYRYAESSASGCRKEISRAAFSPRNAGGSRVVTIMPVRRTAGDAAALPLSRFTGIFLAVSRTTCREDQLSFPHQEFWWRGSAVMVLDRSGFSI